MRPKSGGPVTAGGGEQGRSHQVQTLTWWQPPPDLPLASTSGRGPNSTPSPHQPPQPHLLSPLEQDPSHDPTTSLELWVPGKWGCLPCSEALHARGWGTQSSAFACVYRKCSTTPGLDSQPVFQGAFGPRRQPVGKTTPCTALQRGPHQTASLMGPSLLESPRKV